MLHEREDKLVLLVTERGTSFDIFVLFQHGPEILTRGFPVHSRKIW